MQDFTNDIPKYRKKSTAKPPAKSKHKHVYEPCLFEYPAHWYMKSHEHMMYERGHIKKSLRFGSYCPICGKTGEIDLKRWWTSVKKHDGIHSYIESIYTEEAERELNPVTRTLPVFSIDSWSAKFVDISKE